MGYVMVWVTCPDRRVAEKLSRSVVGERLAACVNLVDVKASIYRWKGKVEKAAEVLMIVKTRRSAFPKLKNRILELHPYDVPEIIATPIVAGHRPYLDWIGEEVKR